MMQTWQKTGTMNFLETSTDVIQKQLANYGGRFAADKSVRPRRCKQVNPYEKIKPFTFQTQPISKQSDWLGSDQRHCI